MSEKMTEVIIATDGACSGNPGPGGWAAILQCAGHERTISGSVDATTNNRMELQAVIEGLKRLRYRCSVVILTDSAYIVNQVNGGWLTKWQKNGWVKADKKPVLNRDLWEQVAELCSQHNVAFEKVRGHANCMLNNRADAIACSERDKACYRVKS